MDDSKDAGKAAKKAGKAEVKRLKKLAKAEGPGSVASELPPTSSPPAGPSPSIGPTPAERSAAAAERQVRLQSRRVWIAALTMVITLAALAIAVKPWQWLQPAAPVEPVPAKTTNSG